MEKINRLLFTKDVIKRHEQISLPMNYKNCIWFRKKYEITLNRTNNKIEQINSSKYLRASGDYRRKRKMCGEID